MSSNLNKSSIFIIIIALIGFIILVGQESDFQKQQMVQVNFMPIKDKIFKIDGDLKFENWNVAFNLAYKGKIIKADRIIFRHFAGQNEAYIAQYNGKVLSEYIRTENKNEALYHNFHFMLPKELPISIFLEYSSISKRSIESSFGSIK